MISERQGPTRSTQTNQILALCQAVLDGGGAEADARRAVDERDAALDTSRREFADAVAADLEADPAAQQWYPFAQTVLAGYDEYKKALGELRDGLKARGKPLESAILALTIATERLFLATDAYEARMVSEGPSRFPMQNYLANMTHLVREGTLSREGYSDILDRTRAYFESCLKEMQNAPESEPPDAIARLMAAFGQCVDAMTEMQRWLQDGDTAHLDRGLTQLEDGQAACETGFAFHRQQKFAAGPTSSAVANAFISAAQQVKAGHYPVEAFMENVAQLEMHAQRIRKDFESACQVSTTSATIQEEIPRAMEAFDLHDEAIEAYRRFLEHKNPADLDEGNARLIEAMKRLDEAKMTFDSVSEREGKTVCPRCGTLNDPANRVCGQCNAALPRMAGGEHTSFEIGEGGAVAPGQDYVLTDNMKRVIEETNKIATGDITPDQYRATLRWMEGVVAAGETSLAAQPNLVVDHFPEEEREQAAVEKGLVDETKAMLADGLQRMRGSLKEMEEFLADGDQQHLMTGLRAFWDASQQVYQVQRIGQMAARAADEGTPEAPPAIDEPVDPGRVG